MLESFSNKNNSSNEKSLHLNEYPPSQSRILHSQHKEKCINCHQNANIICYACCFQVCCQKCFDPSHFMNCERQFNKYTINLSAGSALEESRTKRNGKKSRVFQKCKRCDSHAQQFQNCVQCKTILCKNCSEQIHSKGKFIKHQRCLNLSPQKKKTYQAIRTENCDQNRNSTKQNLQTFDYGLNMNKQQKSKTKVSAINKMGRSMAKVPFQNQQNTPNKKYRRNSMNQSVDHNIKMSKCQPIKQNYQKWQLCQNHNKLRNVLTQTYDLVCGECYEQLKNSFAKLKVIDAGSWMKNQAQRESIFGMISTVIEQSQSKRNEIANDFKRYRQQLKTELDRKCEMLQQKFKNNIFILQKWQNQYNKQLQQIEKSCKQFIALKQKLDLTPQSKSNVSLLLNLHSCLLYEQIMKEKKQVNGQMQQYQFRVAEINRFQFEEIIKKFSFLRRKIDQQSNIPNKILNKMSQSHQLRQSRVSNTSLTTDRKPIKRQESALKSNYYELSNGGNLMKRSISKEIKQDLTKDISQRVLFPISNVRSDKKQKIMKDSFKPPVPRNSNYFFQTATDQTSTQNGKTLRKDGQTLNLGLKQVKYINLETIITQKLDKNVQNSEKRDILQLSTPAFADDTLKKSIYLEQMTQQLLKKSQKDLNKFPISDQRLTHSIIMTQSMTVKANQEPISNNNTINSNANLQNVKNKRKSDYMEMRDRLRKPNLITKIGK